MNFRRKGSWRYQPSACGFSSCLPVGRSDPAEDQHLRWPQETPTLYQQSPDRQRKQKRCLQHVLFLQNVNKCMEMTLSSGSSLEIIFDLFSFNEVDIFLRNKRGPFHAAVITTFRPRVITRGALDNRSENRSAIIG